MKLLTKNTIVFVAATIVVFIAGGFVFYIQLRKIINEETAESLYTQKDQILSFITNRQKLPETIGFSDIVTFEKTSFFTKEKIWDTLIYNQQEEELIPYRVLLFPVTLKQGKFNVSISKSTLESDDLIEAIVTTFGSITIILLLLLLLIHYLFSFRIWSPFFHTINQLKSFEPGKIFSPKETNTQEFLQLNYALKQLTEKISTDFQNIKNFSENASHEIQTPLAVIQNKVELLIQSKNMNAFEMDILQGIHEAANKLSHLNRSLLLLTKIENEQFKNVDPILLQPLLKKCFEMHEDQIRSKCLQVKYHFNSEPQITLHPALAEILIGNLCGNAIKHSVKNGLISIDANKNQLRISNTGKKINLTTEQMFERFTKETENKFSLGLGLSIVKSICKSNNILVTHSFENNAHSFILQWR